MKHITAIEKLESMFFHEAKPTINSHCWLITEQDFRLLILAAKQMEKEQIIDAYVDGSNTRVSGEEYYKEAYTLNQYNESNSLDI